MLRSDFLLSVGWVFCGGACKVEGCCKGAWSDFKADTSPGITAITAIMTLKMANRIEMPTEHNCGINLLFVHEFLRISVMTQH